MRCKLRRHCLLVPLNLLGNDVSIAFRAPKEPHRFLPPLAVEKDEEEESRVANESAVTSHAKVSTAMSRWGRLVNVQRSESPKPDEPRLEARRSSLWVDAGPQLLQYLLPEVHIELRPSRRRAHLEGRRRAIADAPGSAAKIVNE